MDFIGAISSFFYGVDYSSLTFENYALDFFSLI